MDNCFSGKNSLVTGAASGFGFAFAERLLLEGGRCVWMADYNADKLKYSADLLREKFPGKVFEIVVDSSNREQTVSMIERADAECGGLDFLFNNAGRPMTRPSESIPIEEFEDLIRLNYMGVMYGTMTALKLMLPRRRGHIVNTASCGGLVPAPFQTAYASTKAAVICMTRCLAYEYADSGVTFSQISPMNVATSIFTIAQEQQLRESGKSEAEIRKILAGIKPPAGTLPLDEAVDYIFARLAEKQTDIILGENGRDAYRKFCQNRPEYDKFALDLGQKRREFYAALARGEKVDFPG